ncbi:MAG: M28 family peptidase [Nitrospira sp.]
MHSDRTIMNGWVSRIVICLVVLLVTGPQFTLAQSHEPPLRSASESLSSDRMLADIRTLSGPSFNGRQSGTKDDLDSARWVAQEFLSAGLHLPRIRNGSLIIPLLTERDGAATGAMATLVPTATMPSGSVLKIGKTNGLTAKQPGTDYLPIFDSPSADIHGRIVFVGYGIVDPTRGIDDYAGVDVNNNIVLFLRGKPEHYPLHFSHADKVRLARERGALGYLTATGPILQPYEVRRGVTGSPSAFYGQLPLERAIPGAWISTALAQEILTTLKGELPDHLQALQERLNQSPSSQAVQSNQFASLQWKTVSEEGPLINVIGMIPGTGPETVIVGAHRDHFGRPGGILFPGADDNASGTAVILEVARALTKVEQRPSRTIFFISFSGEERDLLGSRLYTSRPIVPLDTTKAMINIDHAGAGNGRLTVGVTGFERDILLEAGKTAGVQDKVDLYGFFPGGDHVPFKEAGVPTVTVVSGGVHPHFHQPTDTVETIDPEILHTVARYVLTVVWQQAYKP